MLIEGGINFETSIHESDLLASLVVEGGILPSAKKCYLQKGILFHCGFGSRLMKFYMAMGARQTMLLGASATFDKNRSTKTGREIPPRVLPSLVIMPQDGFITTGCVSFQSC